MHADEMFHMAEMFTENGIDNTWRNHSDTTRIARQMRRKGMYRIIQNLLYIFGCMQLCMLITYFMI